MAIIELAHELWAIAQSPAPIDDVIVPMVAELKHFELSMRDCRTCEYVTTKARGCVSIVQCVDGSRFEATAPRQYWISGS